jgi:hypothetical protein
VYQHQYMYSVLYIVTCMSVVYHDMIVGTDLVCLLIITLYFEANKSTVFDLIRLAD